MLPERSPRTVPTRRQLAVAALAVAAVAGALVWSVPGHQPPVPTPAPMVAVPTARAAPSMAPSDWVMIGFEASLACHGVPGQAADRPTR